jgi:hypothetical protein
MDKGTDILVFVYSYGKTSLLAEEPGRNSGAGTGQVNN